MIHVDLTTTAQRQLRDLRGRRQKAAIEALHDLLARGCEAAGYRLSGSALEHVCSRHLYADDRMLTAWPTEQSAVVVAIGRHDRSVSGVYDLLMEHLGLETIKAERSKPPCCGEDGLPPVDQGLSASLVDALNRTRRR